MTRTAATTALWIVRAAFDAARGAALVVVVAETTAGAVATVETAAAAEAARPGYEANQTNTGVRATRLSETRLGALRTALWFDATSVYLPVTAATVSGRR